MGSVVIGPPLTEDDLRGRAAWLAGKTIDEVAAAMRQAAAPSGADIADQAARVLSERLAGGR